jgi:hypothetical protein
MGREELVRQGLTILPFLKNELDYIGKSIPKSMNIEELKNNILKLQNELNKKESISEPLHCRKNVI